MDGGPLLPCVRHVFGVAGAVLALWVVVELNPHEVEEAGREGFADPCVGERALRCCTQVHLLASVAVGLEEPGELVPVLVGAALDVEVDAVQDDVPERPRGRRGAAEEVVPDVGGDPPGVLAGGEVIAPDAAADGEQHLDAGALACGDVPAQPGAAVGVGVAVAGEVDHGSLTVAEGGEEGDVDELVVPGGAGLGQGCLVAVLPPVDGDASGVETSDEGEHGASEEKWCGR